MRIRELTLRNYRAFADPSPFKFADRFTVVAGINGRGKDCAIGWTRPLVLAIPSAGVSISRPLSHHHSIGCASRYGVSRIGHEGQLRRDSARVQLRLRQEASTGKNDEAISKR